MESCSRSPDLHQRLPPVAPWFVFELPHNSSCVFLTHFSLRLAVSLPPTLSRPLTVCVYSPRPGRHRRQSHAPPPSPTLTPHLPQALLLQTVRVKRVAAQRKSPHREKVSCEGSGDGSDSLGLRPLAAPSGTSPVSRRPDWIHRDTCCP